jgi:hypothetical protein
MARKYDRLGEARVEVVTTTFVASGRPEGVHDLGRLIENLNNPALSRQLELHAPVVRPLYRATSQLELDAPLLVRREDIIFINFEGPHFTRGLWKPPVIEVPALLMAPPFQVQGSVAVAQDAEITQGLRAMAQGFFVIRAARVFDAEGALLGEGEQIVINGSAVQMMSATRRHITAIGAVPNRVDAADAAERESAEDAPARTTRAA